MCTFCLTDGYLLFAGWFLTKWKMNFLGCIYVKIQVPDKIQDADLNLNFRKTMIKCLAYVFHGTFILKKNSLFIWNSNIAGNSVGGFD
jgi:hypothetical protein